MKRVLVGVCAALLAIMFVPTARAGVNDFTISNYDIKYELSRDDSGRSRLKTVETITAQFPNYDQNHGIERAIPKEYDGHKVSLRIDSVKKADGTKWNYSTYESNGNEVVRIGDADKYVQGEQAYVITYTQRDVTKYFSDTNDDEFYWDTNGTAWQVPISKLNVELTLAGNLQQNLNGNTACYQGWSGSTTPCQLTSSGTSFKTSASGLTASENVTIAIGFKAGTFAKYEPSLWDRLVGLYMTIFFLMIPVAIGVIVWLSIRWSNLSNRKRDLGTVIAEYVPPKNESLTASASLHRGVGSLFTAQLLDFAVRGYLKIYQTREKSLFKAAEYDVEIAKDLSDLKPEEREILTDIFGSLPKPGDKLALKTLKNNTSVYNRTLDNDKKLKSLVRGEYGLRKKDEAKRKWFKNAGWVLSALSILLFNPIMLFVAIVAFLLGYTLWPLTDKGLELYRYLKGLELYIKVAEADRIKMLQSPEGAEKTGGVDPNDPAQLIKLYEKTLPYAVLFGQEKEWSKRIGEIYATTGSNPSWYNGVSAFNAASFSSGLSGFSTAAAYSSASSSSSGGSSGGGSSGGGGGGGGGGGW